MLYEVITTIKGPKGSIAKVRVLGPERKETQCEILASEMFKLGVPDCQTRESGKLDGSSPFVITSYSIHYTKLYERGRSGCGALRRSGPYPS